MGNNHLYHYTSLIKFQSIIRDNKIILSQFQNANDFKERIKGVKTVEQSTERYRYFSTCDDSNEKGFPIKSFLNAMMWYHYGDKCNGVCIEFDKNKMVNMPEKPIRGERVNYRNGVSHIDEQSLLEYLMEKRTCWCEENEYRFIFENVEFIDNIKDYITSIYLGINVKVDDVGKLINENIKIYKIYTDSTDGRFNRLLIR